MEYHCFHEAVDRRFLVFLFRSLLDVHANTTPSTFPRISRKLAMRPSAYSCQRFVILAATTAAIVLTPFFAQAAEPVAAKSTSWSQWRGPNRDGISPEKGLLSEWPKDGPPLVWKVKGLGRGYASVSIGDGKIFSMGRLKDAEHLIALDLKDGSQLWATPAGDADHSNCTPTFDGERVYGVGLNGHITCVDAKTGKQLWQKHFPKDFDGKMHSGWGFSESPLVDGENVIVTPGADKAILAALDKKTGKTVWTAAMPAREEVGKRGGDGAAYSSVVISEAAGVRQYIQLVGRGLIGVRASDGKVLWTYNRVANETANIPTPLVHEDYVFCSSGYGTGAALLKLERDGDGPDAGVKATEQYFLEANKMQNHHGGMILLGDYIYCGHGHDEGFPLCIEWKTGKTVWKPGRGAGKGSAAIACADGNLYFRYQSGVMALVEATPKEYRLKGTFEIAINHGPSWPHPVINEGKLYLRDEDELVCYDIQKSE
jgi:outer membrane protein assembly factor BamB